MSGNDTEGGVDAGEGLASVIAAMRAGAGPQEAWTSWPGAVVDATGQPRELPGAHPVVANSLAAASALAAYTGAPLAQVLEAVARVQSEIAEADLRFENALAGPQASARLLRWLPLGGVALAAFVDVGVLRFLVGTVLGWLLVCLAGVLWWVGQRWSAGLLAAAHREAAPV